MIDWLIDKRCECFPSLLKGNSYTFKTIDKTFNVKAHFTCASFDLLYVSICPTCRKEYTSETGICNTKLRDRVWANQHIRQPEYQKRKIEKHLRMCGKSTFKIFSLLQMRSSEIGFCRSHKRNFMKKYITYISYLWYKSKACTRSVLRHYNLRHF